MRGLGASPAGETSPMGKKQESEALPLAAGLAGWLARGPVGRLLGRLRGRERAQPRLALIERIALAPRQSLALVEAEGRRFLVATSAEGGAAFYALEARAQGAARPARVSW